MDNRHKKLQKSAGGPRSSKRISELSLIGAALKEERIAIGMTQKQLAKQFDVSLKAIRNLEQGRDDVSLSTASKILEYFGKELRVGDIIMSPTHRPPKKPRTNKVLETLRLVKPVLEAKFKVESIALFGSCARDQATTTSDIDLAVKFKQPPSFSTLGRMTTFLEFLFEGQKVDLVDTKSMVTAVARSAKKEFIYV